MKKRNLFLALVLLVLVGVLGCSPGEREADDDYHVDFVESESVFTLSKLVEFFNEGTADTVSLGASIDIGNQMLKLTQVRGEIRILGNGFSITGSGECVIRMEDGAALQLQDLTLTCGADGIGCLGNAQLQAENVQIEALKNGIYCAGSLSIGSGSNLTLSANKGSGVTAKGIDLGSGSTLVTSGAKGGVVVMGDDIALGENAMLSAYTEANYYALKCEGALALSNGARVRVENTSEYHGAEIYAVFADGVATVEATGGAKGVGLFVFRQEQDVYVLGESQPAPRYESGLGSVKFVDAASDIPILEEAQG